MFTRRDVLKGLVLGGFVASLVTSESSAAGLVAGLPTENLLTNGSFEMNGFGRSMTGWSIVELTTQDDR